MNTVSFNAMPHARPDPVELATRYTELLKRFEASRHDLAATNDVVASWDKLHSSLLTHGHLVNVRYHQDTGNAAIQADKKFFDDLEPTLKEWNMKIAAVLISHPLRSDLEKTWGRQFFALLKTQLESFSPPISDMLRQESDLTRRYTDLIAQAEVPFQGETLNLSSLRRYSFSPDREIRKACAKAKADFFQQNAGALDAIYHELVTCRTQMAKTLGYPDFIPLAYSLLARTDYGAADVARLRDEIRREVVPLAKEIREAQRKRLGIDRLYSYDEAILNPHGAPKPQGDTAWIIGQTQALFDAMGSETSAFFSLMRERGLLDLDTRPGKAGGGFCTEFPDYRVPFIFANFNGTAEDVSTLAHECGHAFQSYMSRGAKLVDYLFPTLEACEIHSMSMELLSAPYMELFFGPDAERFRVEHLTEAVLFLPYGAAVDEFQHEVYAAPELAPDKRRALWQTIEKKYLPWRDYDGLPHFSEGGLWQGQSHIYSVPFYYIDYAIAQTCAFQLWQRNRDDPKRAFADYLALCRPGGSLPFTQLIQEGHLISPFEPGCLKDVMQAIKKGIVL